MTPWSPSLAVATLRPILRRDGIESDELHVSLLFPGDDTERVENAEDHYLDFVFKDLYAAHLFAPSLYPDRLSSEQTVRNMFRRHLYVQNLGGIRQPPLTLERYGGPEGSAFQQCVRDVERGRQCIADAVVRAADPKYDVVGLSCTFEGQLPAALAIAKGVKALNPQSRIMIGGSACYGDAAAELVRGFPFVDAVCRAEGDQLITPLVRGLRGEIPLDSVPGIAYRAPSGEVVRTFDPPMFTDLDWLPMPEYGDYVEQLQATRWRDIRHKVYFEASRGCWWGEKHHCTFCGFNALSMNFRQKSPDRVVEEIFHLHEAYPGSTGLEATDNILDMRYFKTAIPKIAARRRAHPRRLHMFFETKSNLRRDQLALMVDAGITYIQPGIESFDDDVLSLMDKGASGIQQIQLVKLAQEYGIGVSYNIILRNPGESAASYQWMLDMVPYLHHLPPPITVPIMQLQRFSPYHNTPERFDIEDVRPRQYYRELYPDPAVDVGKLAYIFDFTHAMDDDVELAGLHTRYLRAIEDWACRYEETERYCETERSGLLRFTKIESGQTHSRTLGGLATQLCHAIDKVRPRAALKKHVNDVDDDILEAAIDTWQHHRWLFRDRSDRVLGLLIRRAEHSLTGDKVDDLHPAMTSPVC